jgi:hypothetical protein
LLLTRTLGRTLQELGETMTAREFGLHWAEYQREPWGDVRVDVAGAVNARTLAEINRDREKRREPFGLADFMPFAPQPEAERVEAGSAQDMFDQLNGVHK